MNSTIIEEDEHQEESYNESNVMQITHNLTTLDIRQARREYPIRQVIPKENREKIEKLLKLDKEQVLEKERQIQMLDQSYLSVSENLTQSTAKPVEKRTGNYDFSKTMANLILSANNPFQEGLPFNSTNEQEQGLVSRHNEDFAYTTGLKAIWNKKKGPLAINQCFNVFQLIRPASDSHRFWSMQQNNLIRRPKVSQERFLSLAEEKKPQPALKDLDQILTEDIAEDPAKQTELLKLWKEYIDLMDCRKKISKARRKIQANNRFKTRKRKKQKEESAEVKDSSLQESSLLDTAGEEMKLDQFDDEYEYLSNELHSSSYNSDSTDTIEDEEEEPRNDGFNLKVIGHGVSESIEKLHANRDQFSVMRKEYQGPRYQRPLNIEVMEKHSSGAKEKSSSGKGTVGPLTAHFTEKEKRESFLGIDRETTQQRDDENQTEGNFTLMGRPSISRKNRGSNDKQSQAYPGSRHTGAQYTTKQPTVGELSERSLMTLQSITKDGSKAGHKAMDQLMIQLKKLDNQQERRRSSHAQIGVASFRDLKVGKMEQQALPLHERIAREKLRTGGQPSEDSRAFI